MKKLLLVLFLLGTLTVTAQKVLKFNTVEVLSEPTQKIETKSIFVINPDDFVLFVADMRDVYSRVSEVRVLDIKGDTFFVYSAESSSKDELIVYFKKDNTGVVIINKDENKAALLFYND